MSTNPNGNGSKTTALNLPAIGYVATLEISLIRGLTKKELDALEPHCRERPEVHYGCRFESSGRTWQWKRCTLQLPTAEALRLLDRMCERRRTANVHRVDIACNLLAHTSGEALVIRDWLKQHIVVPYADGYQFQFKNSTYQHPKSKRERRKSIAYYADKPCPITGRPTCHVEVRHRGKQACVRAGFIKPSDAMQFDAAEHVFGCFHLRSIDHVRLGRYAAKHRSSYTAQLLGRIGLKPEEARRVGEAICNRVRETDEDKPSLRALRKEAWLRGWTKTKTFDLPFLDDIDPFSPVSPGGLMV